MVRRNDDVTPERSKVRVFYAEAEGTPQSIQELIRGLTTAMGRPAAAPPPRLVSSNVPNGKGTNGNNGSASNGHAPAETVEPELFDEVVQESANGESEQATPPEPPRRKRGEGNRDRNSGLSIVKSLNLMPEGKESLKAFVARKKPQNQQEHIAVYIFYLKTVVEEPNVGFSHIFTCFKDVGEVIPLDLPQTCRNTGSKKGWIETSDQDDLKTTTAGDNFVEHKLPQTAASA